MQISQGCCGASCAALGAAERSAKGWRWCRWRFGLIRCYSWIRPQIFVSGFYNVRARPEDRVPTFESFRARQENFVWRFYYVRTHLLGTDSGSTNPLVEKYLGFTHPLAGNYYGFANPLVGGIDNLVEEHQSPGWWKWIIWMRNIEDSQILLLEHIRFSEIVILFSWGCLVLLENVMGKQFKN